MLQPPNKVRECSSRAQKRHYIDTMMRGRQLNLLKEDLTENADDSYKRKISEPIPFNPNENTKSFYNAELERKLSMIDKDLASLKMGRIDKNAIDSITYLSTYQAGYNPKITKVAVKDDSVDYRNTNSHNQTLYQSSFGPENSFENSEFSKLLNKDTHSHGKRNILYHQYSPDLKVEEVIVLDPSKTVYKTSYEKDYSVRKSIKEIPPEQIPIPSSFGSNHNKRNLKYRKWGGYQGL